MLQNRRLGLKFRKSLLGFKFCRKVSENRLQELKLGSRVSKYILRYTKRHSKARISQNLLLVSNKSRFLLRGSKNSKNLLPPVNYSLISHPCFPCSFFTSSTTKLTEAYKYRNECVNLIFCPLTVRHRY